MANRIILLLLLLFPFLGKAQIFPEPHYPQDYFAPPVSIPLFLAGNYGELRPGHFHEGMDIKTRGVIGYKVYASNEGYISRVAVSHVGFGNVIYITHPNGYTTVYAHLHSFIKELDDYVKKQQYEQETWAIDLPLKPDQFPVKQGDYIALSGATGSVAGPHVHFEIRDTQTEHPLNEQLFGLNVKDHIPPHVYRVAVYDRTKSIYEQTPKIVELKSVNGQYQATGGKLTVNWNKIGFGVQTLDKQNDVPNIFGVYRSILYADNEPQIGFQLDNIGYEETRYVDAHYDYKTFVNSRRHFQLLFDLPGNKLALYHDFNNKNGTIDISDGQLHPVKIEVIDASGNKSTVQLNIQQTSGASVSEEKDCETVMVPNVTNIFDKNQVQFFLEPESLYDTICFDYQIFPAPVSGYYSGIYRLHHAYVPLFKGFELSLKPNKVIPDELKDKLIFVRKNESGTPLNYIPAKLEGKWVKATVRDFGDYSIQTDTKPPVIKPVNIQDGAHLSQAKDIQFTLSDDRTGISSYRAELDGKWLRFARKRSTIYYDFDEKCSPGDHVLKLIVKDGVGNTTTKTYHFKR